ncbi:MAG: hypothetical protein NC342_09230 [Pseudoflavonifractor sp.]|nr:hypothetical protein [Alloprevotella sp.]MCM1117701.1 hypothetical protein [Pseudoflavonifractor sp.]
MRISLLSLLLFLLLLIPMGGCNDVDSQRIPLMNVRVSFPTVGDWNIYGVSGAGFTQRFIRPAKGLSEPIGFPYTALSATGFGGVLLVGTFNYSGDPRAGGLAAFDLACPVEERANVRIEVDHQHGNARCPVCGSTYDIFSGNGMPLSGPAAEDKYGLRRYRITSPLNSGEYIVILN